MSSVPSTVQCAIVGQLAKGLAPSRVAQRCRVKTDEVLAVGRAHGYPDLGRLEKAHSELQQVLGRVRVTPSMAGPLPTVAVAMPVLDRARQSGSKRLARRAEALDTQLRELNVQVEAWEAKHSARERIAGDIAKHEAAIKRLRDELKALS